jgi:hypothetical protein
MNPLNNGALNNGAKHKTAGQIPSNNNKVTIEVIPSCRAVRPMAPRRWTSWCVSCRHRSRAGESVPN